MSDWPANKGQPTTGPTISIFDPCCCSGLGRYTGSVASTAVAWASANRAIYYPFVVTETVTALQIGVANGAASGNADVGIYDVYGNRLVSTGSTGLTGTVQGFNIADTVLTPGDYYLALNVDNTTATIIAPAALDAVAMRCSGIQEQAVGAVTLPNPATFANPTGTRLYSIWIQTGSSVV